VAVVWERHGRVAVSDNPGRRPLMVADLLIAALITAVAVVLGIIIHPLLFLIVVFAILLLFARRSSW
jgi:hypothetical protein